MLMAVEELPGGKTIRLAPDEWCGPDAGTMKGYGAHMRADETACDECLAFWSQWMKDYRRRQPRHVRETVRERAAARGRALRRLSREYPERFAQLRDEEAERIVAERPSACAG
jgi:hypothetical protein